MKNIFFSVSVFTALFLFEGCKKSNESQLPPVAKNEAL